MSVLIFIAILFVGYYFIYEGIILPDYRFRKRYDLYALRDELRNLIIDDPSLDVKAFKLTDDFINRIITSMTNYSIAEMIQVQLYLNQNPKEKKRIDSKLDHFRDSAPGSILGIHNRATIIAVNVTFANSGGWFPITFPLAMFVLIIKKLFKITTGIGRMVQESFAVPNSRLDRPVYDAALS